MAPIARKNLFAEKTKFAVSVGGVAFSILLVVFLLGIYQNMNNLATAYINHTGASVVVAQEGVTDMFHTFSMLSRSKISSVESVAGGTAYGIISRVTNAYLTEDDGSPIIDYPGRGRPENPVGKKETISIIGYDGKNNVGGPWLTVAGTKTPGKREIIVDQSFVRKNKLRLGSQIEIFGKVFTISGITSQNNMLTYTRGFINFGEAEELLNERGFVNYILLYLPDSKNPKTVATAIDEKISGVSAYATAEFAKSNAKVISESFLPIILVITIIGFLTGAVVTAINIYTSTMERKREFGVLKALGAGNLDLYKIVFEQSLTSTIVGFGVGVILSLLVKELALSLVPVLPLDYSLEIYGIAFTLAISMSLLASYIPIRIISRLDPALVFNS